MWGVHDVLCLYLVVFFSISGGADGDSIEVKSHRASVANCAANGDESISVANDLNGHSYSHDAVDEGGADPVSVKDLK
jgi:hypothetical protein